MWPFNRKKEVIKTPQPISKRTMLARQYESAQTTRFAGGWTNSPIHIDQVIRDNLTSLRARSREQMMNNDYAKRFLDVSVSNIVGPEGFYISSNVRRLDNRRKPDNAANESLNEAWADWSNNYCDVEEQLTFLDIQKLYIASVITDGEFLAEIDSGPQAGKYGFQLRVLDPELLDVKFQGDTTTIGKKVRNGIEYDVRGRPVAYYLKKVTDYSLYSVNDHQRIPKSKIIHCFVPIFVNQNRGVPWLSTALLRMKMLHGYEEAAVVNARIGAQKVGFYKSMDGSGYTGEENTDGTLKQELEPGMMEQLPDGVDFTSWDPTYPSDQFNSFVKSMLRGVASGLGISYNTLANDLEGVNYSSIRAGLLEDRELWKSLQNWQINRFISKVHDNFIDFAILTNKIKIGNSPLNRFPDEYKSTIYKGRRWEWVDPQKDVTAAEKAISLNIASRSQLIRKQGLDPMEVFQEIADENEIMEKLGIKSQVVETETPVETVEETEDE